MNHPKSYYEKLEVLSDLEPVVQELIAKHIKKKKSWYSSDLLPSSEHNFDGVDADVNDTKRKNLRERARIITNPAKVALTLNLITEDNLPHYHRIISSVLGDNTSLREWTNLWTAEEEMHGATMTDYFRDSAMVDYKVIEKERFANIKAGFYPDWSKDPYQLFVYTTAQEKATQVSHLNTGKYSKEPTLLKILENIAQDESGHYAFYFAVSANIISRDPNTFLPAALAILPSLEMPGIGAQNYTGYSEVIMKAGIFGPWHYKKIVEDILSGWKVADLTGLDDEGRKAQDSLMKIPSRIERFAKIVDAKKVEKSFSFPVIYNRVFNI